MFSVQARHCGGVSFNIFLGGNTWDVISFLHGRTLGETQGRDIIREMALATVLLDDPYHDLGDTHTSDDARV